MKIFYTNELSENAPGARVAQLLAERVGDTAERLQPSGDRPTGWCSEENGPRGKAGKSGVRTLAARHPVSRVTPETNSGSLTMEHPTGVTLGNTRLIVASRSPRRDSENAHPTERLALTTQIPTLVTHEPARILAWLNGKRPLRILCAHDLTSVADEALRFVRQISDLGRCEITVAHVHRSVEQVSHPGCVGVGAMRKHDLELRSVLDEKIQERARILLGDQPVTTRVSPAPFQRDDFIFDLLRETDADLVVTPLHPSTEADSLLGAATSRTLLCLAEANLVLVPPALISQAKPKNVIRRVLVVADLTSTDARIMAQARALLGPGGRLRVLHVVHPHAVPDTEYDRNLGSRQQEAAHSRLVASSHKLLRTLAQNEVAVSGIPVESEVVEHRNRALAIAHAAERFDADVACLALAERPTFLTRLRGTQLHRLLAKGKRSLLIVQPSRD